MQRLGPRDSRKSGTPDSYTQSLLEIKHSQPQTKIHRLVPRRADNASADDQPEHLTQVNQDHLTCYKQVIKEHTSLLIEYKPCTFFTPKQKIRNKDVMGSKIRHPQPQKNQHKELRKKNSSNTSSIHRHIALMNMTLSKSASLETRYQN